MFNVMMILLHRPFVSDGHLQSTSPSVASEAFSICSVAASEIDHILAIYERHFCMASTPYIISYATYVGATIHVRIAAQRAPGSEAHKSLQRCVDVLDLHQTVCWSARRAKRIVDNLISRMGVILAPEASDGNIHHVMPDIDINAVMRTFTTEQLADREFLHSQQQGADIDQHDLGTDGSCSIQNLGANIGDPNDNTIASGNKNLDGDYLPFLYDPIFGFTGSPFDEYDVHPVMWDG